MLLGTGTSTYFDCGELFKDGERETETTPVGTVDGKTSVVDGEEAGDGEEGREKDTVLVNNHKTQNTTNQHKEEAEAATAEAEKEEEKTTTETNGRTTTSMASAGIWDRLARSGDSPTATSDINAIVEVISTVHLLSHLPTRHLQRICKHVRIVRLQAGESVFYQHTTAHCMYIILHGSVSVHLENKAIKDAELDKKQREEKEKEEKEKKEEEEKKHPEKKKNSLQKEKEEVKDGKEEAPPPPAPFLHALSWEEQTFSHDEPHTRGKGTLSTTGGKYLVTLHPGQAFGEQALAESDESHETTRR